jgi:drug/metabolite transporter (DMT)-like permease
LTPNRAASTIAGHCSDEIGDPVQRAAVVGLASAVLFGMSTPLAKLLLGPLSPLLLAGLLYAGSGVGLMLLLAARRALVSRAPPMNLPRRGEWAWLVAAIAFGGVVGPVALMYGLAITTASTASLLLNLEAVFTALMAWFLFRENFDRRVMSGMVAIIVGGALLAWAPAPSGGTSLGVLLIGVACLCWAVDNNLTRKVSASDAVFIAGIKGLVAGAVNLTLALAIGQVPPSSALLVLALALGFVGYGVSLVLFVLALRHLGTARAAAYFSVAPFFGAAVALLIEGAPPTAQQIAAGILMAAGVWLHLTEKHEHEHLHEALVHEHDHMHDDHHRHAHDPGIDHREPHSHVHAHSPTRHAHAHAPDVHHRHEH